MFYLCIHADAGKAGNFINFRDHLDLIKKDDLEGFLKKIPNPLAYMFNNTPLLLFAVYYGKIRIPEYLIRQTSDLDFIGMRGLTALTCAVVSGNIPALEFLLSEGADPDCTGDPERGPLQRAVKLKKERIASLLIQAGADVKVTAPLGQVHPSIPELPDVDVLGLCARNNIHSVVPLLKESGADFNAVYRRGVRAVHLAARFAGQEMMSFLKEYGADINAQDSYGFTPLHLAAHAGNVQSVVALLSAGAHPNLKDKHGKTAGFYLWKKRKLRLGSLYSFSFKIILKNNTLSNLSQTAF